MKLNKSTLKKLSFMSILSFCLGVSFYSAATEDADSSSRRSVPLTDPLMEIPPPIPENNSQR